MNFFAIITSLFAISSIFSYINARWIKLPGVIGVMLLAIFSALITVFAGKMFPQFTKLITDLTASINFSNTLLDILLGFLLFASALHFDIKKLRSNLKGVVLISTVGVLLSTLIFAGMFYYISGLIGIGTPFIYCLVFGALISPTDAVAVAALLKKTKMPERLETIINGESLFNDGIGIVLFITFAGLASTPGASLSWQHTAVLFAQEVLGGLLLGLALGWITLKMIQSIQDFQTIVMISFTLVMIISLIGSLLHVSIPLAVVAAGLLIGSSPLSRSRESKLSDYLDQIWKLFDELLNTILFVMIGLQMVSVSFSTGYFIAGGIAIIILLLARLLSIVLPIVLLRHSLQIKYSSILILTWGGLRGGISVALALSLPPSPYRELILTASFCIVVFSIIVQGLTLNKVVNKLV
ncbi:CPA1 family monovalent cation:H+ antiporter [Pedobacter sp. CAN_A7]|uniref:cation:proton antiporter n=1 Tax=Pedobacter sp. CAN_A7 TaxID=2787722 RepID=UPI0018CADD5D